MCHKHQSIQKELFRGTSRECRVRCMKLNNQRMESDFGFIDPSPQDLMNESLKSEFDLSFASQRSATSLNGSLLQHTHDSWTSGGSGCGGSVWSESPHIIKSPREQLHHQFHLQQISNASSSSTVTTPVLVTPIEQGETSSSPPDSKRKYEMAVTPQKDRDHKRQRPVSMVDDDAYYHCNDPQSKLNVEFHPVEVSSFQQQNIRAEFRYKHLSSPHEDWHMDQEVPNGSCNNVTAASNHPIWSNLLNAESLPE